MKTAWLSSPGSTVAPSSAGTALGFHPDEADRCSDTDYQNLPELAALASAGASASSRIRQKKFELKLASFVVLFAASIAGLLVVSASRWKPRIWDPDLRREFSTEPLAKSVIRKFDAYNMARGGRDDHETFKANVNNYMMPDLFYESVGFGTWRTPAGWSLGEEHNYGMAFPETIFTQMLFFGDERVATTTTYGSALWGGDLFGVKAAHQWVTLRITDFYSIQEEAPGYGRISYNFMMIDWADALRQIGRRMLPQAPLEEGIVLPPAANDGVPAPLSVLVQSEGRDGKAAHAVAEAALQQDWTGMGDSLQHWHEDLNYYGPGGIGLARNLSSYKEHVLGPFRAAFTDRKAVIELSACEGNYCGLFGRLSGHGVGEWLGLPTAGQNVSFRFAMHYRVVGGKVQEGWTILDFPGLFANIGLDFYALAAAGGRVQGKHVQ
mmetsp:Transcript_173028/g.420896  ORF Transcript_173028/g.420896 Transcript_173028/m.420896 type:complete len:437 (-) Transcript_173028:218-1528(-)